MTTVQIVFPKVNSISLMQTNIFQVASRNEVGKMEGKIAQLLLRRQIPKKASETLFR